MHFCHIVVRKRRSWRGAGEGEGGREGGRVEPVAVWMRNASLKANKGLWREAAPASQSKMDAF